MSERKVVAKRPVIGNLRQADGRMLPSQSKRSPWFYLIVCSIALSILLPVYSVLDSIKDRWYIFDHTELAVLAKNAVNTHGNDTRAVIDTIVSELKSQHPSYAIASQEEWIFNNAGGAMGAMYLIHASITEYLIVFGTPLGTEGHTGRHTADDYFHILQGEQWAFPAGALEMEIYPAGSVHHLRRGQVKQYKMHEGCWALELAQGWIPLMLPFGFADSLTSTLDLPTLYHTVRITGREMIKNLLHGKI